MKHNHIFDSFDDDQIAKKIIDFKHNNITKVRFLIPSIHCSSCIFILEKISKRYEYIIDVNVDFNRKQVWITFNNKKLKISELANILHDIGYPPSMDMEFIDKKTKNQNFLLNRKLIAKFAISFFCFGNIMLLSIPGYVGADNEDIWFFNHRNFFRYLMLILSLPIVFYFSIDHIKYAIVGLKKHILNMDVPISIGILVLFSWSCYEIFFDLGAGYFDSIASFSLFLSISKIFQNYTHNKILSFNRNYKSYFSILITKVNYQNKKEEKTIISSIKKGDIIVIKNEEIIPVDSILIKGSAILDNSFITGESYLVNKKIGDHIYAGSKQKGGAIYLKVIKDIDHSYLSLLWNKKKRKLYHLNSISNKFIQYFFTPVVLSISMFTGLYWYYIVGDISKVFQTTFSVLIISCPCAIAISTPLIFGNIIRYFSRKGFYVKDIYTMERISAIKTLIFDKTGTITDPNKDKVFFFGKNIGYEEKKIIASLLRNSTHPLSNRILSELSIKYFYSVDNFKEVIGKGIEGIIKNMLVKIGSAEYLGISLIDNNAKNKTVVAISINDKFIGYFLFRNYYRKNIENIFQKIKKYKIIILSGDHNELEKRYLKSILPNKYSDVFFSQTPEDKLDYVKKLKNKGEKVIMIGDGINDCAALNESDVGIAISDNPTGFFPTCDAFLQSDFLDSFFLFLKISKISSKLVIINFIISLFYNGVGLIFSITGNLKPLIAAILMPLSSFSVITFSIISTWFITRRLFSYNL
ncbi:heavy metal translocating P-type ATPase [Blattabacterium cuenoti]|uniref:heavy metal translocating P-type ATPase n=1 Tax=Blattabacterium cuenoti TaxID=1653831 RepID=UPI00163D38CA|nr:heavy metal translocating P-type ATPase [Blattabacterium cuenoti]